MGVCPPLRFIRSNKVWREHVQTMAYPWRRYRRRAFCSANEKRPSSWQMKSSEARERERTARKEVARDQNGDSSSKTKESRGTTQRTPSRHCVPPSSKTTRRPSSQQSTGAKGEGRGEQVSYRVYFIRQRHQLTLRLFASFT